MGFQSRVVETQLAVVQHQLADGHPRAFVALAAVQQPGFAAIGSQLQHHHRLAQAHRREHQTAPPQGRQFDAHIGAVGNQHLRLAGPRRVGKTQTLCLNPQQRPSQTDVQIASDHQLAPGAGLHLALQWRTRPVPTEHRHPKRCQQKSDRDQRQRDPEFFGERSCQDAFVAQMRRQVCRHANVGGQRMTRRPLLARNSPPCKPQSKTPELRCSAGDG